ncbi:hypothetical protein ACFE04_003589 [Oxalis oulophora]
MENSKAQRFPQQIPIKISKQQNSTAKQCIIRGKLIFHQSPGESCPRKSVLLRIHSCTQVDPTTMKGKFSEKASLRHVKSNKHNGIVTTTYALKLKVDPDFGIPGALAITNRHKHKFFLLSVTLETHDNQVIHFDCNSWIYPFELTEADRIFFSNTSYLPSQTPRGLEELRREELTCLRGDGTGERKEWDRVYEYDCYNDLGDPDKGEEHRRLVLGGSESYPYPRRGRTGRPPTKEDASSESRPDKAHLDIYVPPDERLSPEKISEFTGNVIQAVAHFLVPEAKSLLNHSSRHFHSFDEIMDLYSNNSSQVVHGWMTDKIKKVVPGYFPTQGSKSATDPIKFPLPQIITENELAWMNDEEFGRQMLAGINAPYIKCLDLFPPHDKNGVQSSIDQRHVENNLDGLHVEDALNQWRLFILDHCDYLMPFLNRINKNGICAYASRTIFFLRDDNTLKPVAIELALDYHEVRVFVPPRQGIEDSEAAIWQLAKAHVLANDSAYHQLISHWLHSHAVVEPFIIATRRQLSMMHPIHRLLDPHFKDTMHINALARSLLVNSQGILEKILFTGELSMELSSELYKEWRFDEQALPVDLLKRGMAYNTPDNPCGVQLTFEDYPYGLDGLEIWTAIKSWVADFCNIFYENDASVSSDEEIQAWWSEIKNIGHGDKRNETWWSPMKSLSNLIEVLTTIIWITSAFHASVNFGQYAYAGYPPNRPTLCRKFVPEEGTNDFAEFMKDPDKYYLNMLPERSEITLAMALMEVLSRHTSDEVYLGQKLSSEWTDNTDVKQRFNNFVEKLEEFEKRIMERNRDPKFKNRHGPAKIPYKLLYPNSSNVENVGLTGKGIPNSISN